MGCGGRGVRAACRADAIRLSTLDTVVALSFQLPFAIWPLIRLTSDRGIMGRHANGWAVASMAWMLFVGITAANIWLLGTLLPG